MKEQIDNLSRQLDQAKKIHDSSQELAQKAINSMPESDKKSKLIALQKQLRGCKGDAVKIQALIEEMTNLKGKWA